VGEGKRGDREEGEERRGEVRGHRHKPTKNELVNFFRLRKVLFFADFFSTKKSIQNPCSSRCRGGGERQAGEGAWQASNIKLCPLGRSVGAAEAFPFFNLFYCKEGGLWTDARYFFFPPSLVVLHNMGVSHE